MPASIGVNLRVTGHCSQGGRKYMEDLFSVAYQQTEDERDLEYAFFGIYDGHGGSEAASFAKEHLMDSIVKQRQFWSDNDEDVLKAIRNGYMLTHLNMWKELEKWPKTITGLPSTAGTTASIAFIRRGKIYIGHVGDSAIVLGYQKDSCEEWAAKPLTSDHKPESTAEMERIQRCGGKVVSKAGVPRVVWNRPRPGHKGPIKKNTPMDEIPFLAVARSLGDLWSYNSQNDEFIVSPDPDVGVLTIDPSKFRCLIFGTDGLWNMISPEGAVNLVQATERHNEAALVGSGGGGQQRDWLNPSKSLVDHALERWSNTRMRADNTSVVTLMLDPPGPPRATVLRSRSAAQKLQPSPATSNATSGNSPHSGRPESHETPRNEVPSDIEGRRVPQNGLTIMTRYSDVERPASSPGTPERTPLPPCATLDGRFSIGSVDDVLPEEENDPADAITNYGNPAESYFMARLLNRNRIVNTLSYVYDEIFNGQLSKDAETRELSPPPMTSLPNPCDCDDKVQAINDIKSLGSTTESNAESTCSAISVRRSSSESDKDVESIQINEVSSSSPTDSPPKPRSRRPKSEPKADGAVPVNGRVLRSHDAETPHRPQTRQTAHRGRPPNAPQATLERVVILSRARGVPIPPAMMRVDRSPVGDARTPNKKSSSGDCASKQSTNRVTRSRESTSIPLAQKITRSLTNVARELRGDRTASVQPAVTVARTGNSLRAPGPSRRSTLAARADCVETSEVQPEYSKENFGAHGVARRRLRGGRRREGRVAPLLPAQRPRTRLLDSGVESARPVGRPARRCRSEDTEPSEVHSTSDQQYLLDSKVLPVVKPRALRSRNDAEVPSAHVLMQKEAIASKRPPRREEDQPPASKAPKLVTAPERCTRALGKRVSGPWAPALALRNRLRKRLTK